MCGLAAASLAATVIGGAVQAYGQMQAGKAEQERQEYTAAVNRNNAIRADYLAEDAIDRGNVEEANERLRGRIVIGQIRAVMAGSGQVVDEGSAMQFVADQSATNEQDARTIRNNAQREAQEHRLRATDYRQQADLNIAAGNNARTAGNINAFGTLIGAGGRVADKWYRFQRVGTG